MKLAIHVNTLKALLLFAAQKDIRYYLNAVYIETGTAGTRAVTTNGNVMAAANLPMLGSEAASIIIPRDALETALKAVGKEPVITLEFDAGDKHEEHSRSITVTAGVTTLTVKEVDGKYPQWRRVFPVTCSGEPAQFNPEYLMDAFKAAQLVLNKRTFFPGIAHNGSGPGVVNIGQDFSVLIMPLRDPQTQMETPAWIKEPVSPALETAEEDQA